MAYGGPGTAIEIMTIDGFQLAYADENAGGGESASALTTLRGPHLAVVTTWASGEVSELVVGTAELIPWEDLDDGIVISKPDTVFGNLDFPGDFDWYWIDLGDGQSVTIEVDSVVADPSIYVDSLDNLSEFALAFDDDSGGGVFGTNPRVVYTAEETGPYLVVVADGSRSGPGAYVLTVE